MKTRRILIAVAVLLLIGGLTMCGIAFASNNFDMRFDHENMVTNTFVLEDSFNRIDIDVDTADVVFEKAGDGKCRVECYEYEYQQHDVKVESGKLVIKVKPSKNVIKFGIYTEDPKITVYLTADTFDSVSLRTDTGDIKFGEIYAGDLDISTDTGDMNLAKIESGSVNIDSDTGDINLNEISLKDLKIETDTGDIGLTGVVAEGDFNIETDTGEISFDGCDAANLYVKSDTGDVSGTLISGKEFETKSDTGDVNVPGNGGDGKCNITTSTGDVNIRIKG